MDNNKQYSGYNPWKGLIFYEEGELLFGRDAEIQDLSLYIVNNTQVVLYGKSGIGKSSIIRAGVFPIARKAGLFPIPIRLNHDGNASYIKQIVDAFTTSGIGITPILPSVNENDESIWEFIHRHIFSISAEDKTEVRPLLVFDQFEEIFTLQKDEVLKKNFFRNLADLINEVVPDYIAEKLTSTGKNGGNNEQISDGIVLNFGPSQNSNHANYTKASLFNMVFIIRDDYLSYLERYTVFIPEMKSNRFALLPLNAKQAEEIIIKPIESLVDKSVAAQIIEKVTDRTDISTTDYEDIEVDATILSLYLNRLFELNNGKPFSKELVDKNGNYIIRSFYNDCIKDFPEETIKNLGITLEEDMLVNGHRDNQSYDYIKTRIGEEALETLINRKLFRTFPYGKDTRVELIHDKLCDVIQQVKEEREVKEQQENMRLAILAEEQRKRQRMKKGFGLFFMIAAVTICYVLYKYVTKKPIPEDKYVDVVFIFKPENMLEGDNWKARVFIEAYKDSTYKMSILNKKLMSNDCILVQGPNADTIIVRMLMSEMERPFNVVIDSKREWLCKSDTPRVALERPKDNELQIVSYCIDMQRDKNATYLLKGKVVTQYDHPIYNAFVILEEKMVRSNHDGSFAISIKDPMALKGSTLYVLKSEYEAFEKDGSSVLMAIKESIDSSYTIKMQRREKYDTLFAKEISHTNDIIQHLRDNILTANDSVYLFNYFGNWNSYKSPSCAQVVSGDTIITYIFRLSNAKSESDKGRIFGLLSGKNIQQCPFNGYLEEIEPLENGKRRWRMNIIAHDSIYNQKFISGVIVGKTFLIDKTNAKKVTH